MSSVSSVTGTPQAIAAWISSLPASRVSPTAAQGDALERAIRATCGLSLPSALARLDPVSSSLKMSLESCGTRNEHDAYTAGLIDGEGTISIWSSSSKLGKTFAATVQIGMSEKAKPILESVKASYGGRLRKFREPTSAWSAGWILSLFGQPAKQLLVRIHPFLRLKQEQATLALRLFCLVEALPTLRANTHRWSEEAREYAAALATMMTELNKKGPMQTSGMIAGHPMLDYENPWITAQRDLLGLPQPFMGPWPESGMTRDGVLYQLPPLVLRTSVGGGGVLPTPQTTDAEPGGGPPNKRANTTRWGGVNSLGQMAKQGLWPTPRAQSANGKGLHGQGGVDLQTQVGGMLNPRWTEWLMGIPVGWTSLEPLATGSYQLALPSSSSAYQEWLESFQSLLEML